MKKFLLSLLLTLLASSPVFAQRTVFTFAEKGIFKILNEKDDGLYGGTAFCYPGRSNYLITAAHVVIEDPWVVDSNGVEHTVKVMLKDTKEDIAVLLAEEPLCRFNDFKFAPRNASPGTDAWMFGYGGMYKVPLLTRGVIASIEADHRQMAQLNALFGHSGSPVFNAQNELIGLESGGVNEGDEMDVIIPVETIRKVIK